SGLLFCVGCDSDDGKSNSGEKSYKIGISIPTADHGWTGGVVYFANAAQKKIEQENSDVKVVVSSARDAAEQVDRLENLLVQNVDAIVVLPQEPAPLTAVCEKIKAKGIKLIVVDRGLTKDIQDLSVVGDNPGFGEAAAKAIAADLKGEGKLVIMEGVPCAVNSDRVDAFKKYMQNYPKIEILDSQSAYWDTEKGLKLMENYLQKHPQIDAVWAGDDDVLLGALKAYQESGRKDVKLFVGGGGSKSIIKKIMDKDPAVRLTVTYPPKMILVAAEQAVKLVKNQEIPAEKRLVVPAEVITPENAAANYYPESAY
ncbi:MAG: substrate-binding domain-containing protein, partial [Victivallaceae bacterium]